MHLNKAEAYRALGLSQNTYTAYEAGHYNGKPRPIPRHVALACAAIAYGLKPIP
jgi:hypothetical protein